MIRKVLPPNRKPARGSKTGRPVMALLDLLGRRWTLRIVWEMREQTLTSRALRGACDDASPTVIQTRLAELRAAGFVEKLGAGGYRLTAQGNELLGTFMPLHKFAEKWSKAGRETARPIPPAGSRHPPARS